jgi:hypothetical protein
MSCHISVGVAICASGNVLLPQIILPLENLPFDLDYRLSNFPYPAFFTKSDNGWATQVANCLFQIIIIIT